MREGCVARVARLLLLLTATASGLRVTRLSVPEAVERGSSLLLACDFDLEGETLYSVRWYKNHEEFYRFLPSDVPTPATHSRLPGASVDVRLFPLHFVFVCATPTLVSPDDAKQLDARLSP